MAITVSSATAENAGGCNHYVVVANFDGTQVTERYDRVEAMRQITDNLPAARRLFLALILGRCLLRDEPVTGIKVPNPGDIATFQDLQALMPQILSALDTGSTAEQRRTTRNALRAVVAP